MKTDLKDIHIGEIIYKRVNEIGIDLDRICSNMNLQKAEIENIYKQETLETKALLKWCKLLEYDFFRLFSQHLILYTSPKGFDTQQKVNTELPLFRKNLYTKDVIFYILDVIENKEKTRIQVIEDYKIPKSTLNRWINKYKNRI
ncbi:transposase [Chryseobacterium sp. CFS15]|uniref:transposase n=1 Tax=Chryseobacterium sp. CFS15 TaxID=2986946 RepID=UPI00280887BE|nr:transposase [Chryseobacterium sp. CFS15]MDQ8140474.1 transposase [Chryseobacterium sp. CFS15]